MAVQAPRRARRPGPARPGQWVSESV